MTRIVYSTVKWSRQGNLWVDMIKISEIITVQVQGLEYFVQEQQWYIFKSNLFLPSFLWWSVTQHRLAPHRTRPQSANSTTITSVQRCIQVSLPFTGTRKCSFLGEVCVYVWGRRHTCVHVLVFPLWVSGREGFLSLNGRAVLDLFAFITGKVRLRPGTREKQRPVRHAFPLINISFRC